MKKASATVIYNAKTNQIVYMTINYKEDLIQLVNYSEDTNRAYKYNCFQDLYKTVLKLAKMNNFYFESYKAFSATWHDIQWIDCNNPVRIDKYSIKEIEK